MLIVLVGPQGSGKTTYCRETLKAVEPSKATPGDIVRISQDNHGKKGHIEKFLTCLENGQSVVIDRINHIRFQRRRYTEAGRNHGYKIKYIWLDVDRKTCTERLDGRTGHPTIRPKDNHERILACYFRDFEKPEYFEYDEIEVMTKRQSAKMLDLSGIIGDTKFIVVGDIHGCYDEFLALLNQCGYKPGDFLVSVGDLMDRGPKSREVIQWFLDADNAFCTEGNHDNKARRYWAGNRVKVAHGLDKTIEQCKDMHTASIADWIKGWPQMIRLPDFNGKPTYVVHAGVDGKYPIDNQPLENCLYARYFGGQGFLDQSGDIWYSTLDGSFNIISGHMIHDNAIPTDCGPMDYVFLLDGGACQGGELRALVVEDGKHRIEAVKSKDYQDEPQNSADMAVSMRDELVERRLLRCDDKGDLRIYTYTDNCVFEKAWTDITLNSRGIILNRRTGEVVARPFPKFFNVGEREDTVDDRLPWGEDYRVFEKMDGWLGILYRYDGEYCVSTRGSFDGQGMGSWATDHLRKNYDLTGLPDDVTLVFEIVCPTTHIIVNYGDHEALVLLAAYNRHTGEEYSWDQVTEWGEKFRFAMPRTYAGDIQACRELLNRMKGNAMEGFVIRFANGRRVKIKSEDYKRRAAIVSHLTPLAIWKAMRDGTLTDDYRDSIDADYVELFDDLIEALWDQRRKIHDEIRKEFNTVCVGLISQSGGLTMTDEDVPKCGSIALSGDIDRKDFALKVQSLELKHPSAMFCMLDGQDERVQKYILTQMRPHGNELMDEHIALEPHYGMKKPLMI